MDFLSTGWQSLLGFVVIAALAWLLSENRSAIRWSAVLSGLALQVGLAALLLTVPPVQAAFAQLNTLALALQQSTQAGTSFVFGYLGGGELPFAPSGPGSSFVLAFQALPLVLVTSALSALLFYWRVLPWLVRGVSWLLRRGMGLGGALSVGVTANIFVGMIEAPLFIRPYIREMGRGELFALMTAGMATIAGTVIVLYAQFLAPVIPDSLGHIITASVISAPAAVALALIMVPEAGPGTAGRAFPEQAARGSLDAITRGTLDGVTLLLNITAMLLVLVALVHLLNQTLGWLPPVAGEALTLQRALGWALAPLAWLLGIPWAEAVPAGSLLGTKVVLNELLAYLELANLPDETLSGTSRLILTYALCGFANFGSLGIMIGGMGGLCPERRPEIVALGLRAVVAGLLTTCMTGSVIGMLAWLDLIAVP